MFSLDRFRWRKGLSCTACFTMLAMLSMVAGAQTKRFYVAGDAQGESASGDSWKTAYPSLQKALEAASKAGGGEIWVKAGVYKPAGEKRSATFGLTPGIGLYGGFRGTEGSRDQRNPKANRTVLSGDLGATGRDPDNCHHVLTGTSDSRIDGFIVSRGNANGVAGNSSGGGIFIPAGTRNLVIANCTFEKNSALSQGGAVYADRTGLVLTNCTFYSNAAGNGGAVCMNGASTLSIQSSFFSDNFARTSGGAIELNAGVNAVLENASFTRNSTDGNGGALAALAKSGTDLQLEIRDSQFNNNLAGRNGGAVFISGKTAPILEKCAFNYNIGNDGAGGIGNAAGATVVVAGCSFTHNLGSKGMEDIGNDADSLVADSVAALAALQHPNPEQEEALPAEAPKKFLADVDVFNAQNTRVGLQGLVTGEKFTVLVLGDLTDPDFIENYRSIEAAARDYSQLHVQFLYIYRSLAHPENNGYLQPFNETERARQTQLAASLLMTKPAWLYDCMDNQTLAALSPGNNENIFLYSSEGVELFSGSLNDTSALYSALRNIVGPSEIRTSPNHFHSPKIPAMNLSKPVLVKRVRFKPESEPFSPLKITPKESRFPYYAKLRAEADDNLLASGTGKLYIGFNVDPLYQMEWDNRAEPLKYTLTSPIGVAAPSIDTAPQIDGQPSDSEPREFVLNARKLDVSQPLMLQVDYSVHSASQNKDITVSQRYAIHLELDPCAGTAYRRQIAYDDPPMQEEESIAMPPSLRQYDANGDGQLTRGELGGNLWSKFPEMDTNRDGYLSEEEYRTYTRTR